MISLLLLLALPAAAGPAPVDPCKPPFASITTCPDNYMPFPVQLPVSVGDKNAIAALVQAAQALEVLEKKARTDLTLAGVMYRANTDKTSAKAVADRQQLNKKGDDLRLAKLATQTAYDAAIAKTADVYRLTPRVVDFSQDASLGEPWRAMRPWLPRYSTEETVDKITGQWRRRDLTELANEEAENKAEAAALGVTGWRLPAGANTDIKTGQMRIFGYAVFDDKGKVNPDHLAALILHETTHWVDSVSAAGKIHTLADKYALEARAYANMARLNAALGNQAEATAQTKVAAQYEIQRAESKRLGLTADQIRINPHYRRWLRVPETSDMRGGGSNPGDPESQKVAGEESFLDGLPRLGDASANARDITRTLVEREQREREEYQRRDHAAFLARRAAQEAAVRAAYQYLKTAAGLACADPEAFQRESEGGAVISVGINDLDFGSFLSSDINEVGWKSLGVKPNACQEAVMRQMIQTRGQVSPGTVAVWANAYRNAHPSLLKRFATSIGEFFEVKAGYVEEASRAESSSASSSSGSTSSEPKQAPEERQSQSPPREYTGGNREREAAGRLRGIDATKKW